MANVPRFASLRIDETHDPALRSWVESANQAGCDFPVQNLPFAVFRENQGARPFRPGVAIGEAIVDLSHPAALVLMPHEVLSACTASTLSELMAMGSQAASDIRLVLSRALRADSSGSRGLEAALVPQAAAVYAPPARIGDFTDFYSSIHHAITVGRLLRPDQPLFPNYPWLPIAYHGRASTIDVSEVPVRRPCGQVKAAGSEQPSLVASARLDYELELGVFIGAGNGTGDPIAVGCAWDHIFGVVLLNDWSARDLQAWEYQPLGPFLSKNFATRISPWIVTAQALLPYRCALKRPPEAPAPLPYLHDELDASAGALDIALEARIRTPAMRSAGLSAERLSVSNANDAYWTLAQLLTHHSVNGCRLRPGDLIGTGTLSGPQDGQGGCLLELTKAGRVPLRLADGETRGFLEDGDEIILSGACLREGWARIGLGSVRSVILGARTPC